MSYTIIFNKKPINLIMIFGLLFMLNCKAQTKLEWPLSEQLHSKTYISNYVDVNKSTNIFKDFNCGSSHGYDGHLGIDIGINSFRESDQGVAVLAATSGVVTIVRDGQFDRNYWPPYTGSGNGLWIKQDNGDYSIYWHMRKSSIPVKVGDRVETGQFIGYVASSGSSPIPHLHFQINNSANLNDNKDPYSGSCNSIESLWQNQPPYVSNDPLKVMDFGITNNHNYNGVYQNGAFAELKDKLVEPIIYGVDEINIGVWAQFQGNLRDNIKFVLTNPSGELFNEVGYRLQKKRRYGWYVYDFPFSSNFPEVGVWTLTVSNKDGVLLSKNFQVGNQTKFAPRFYPISGQSIQINGSDQSINLIEMGLSGEEVTYKIIGAPIGFNMNGNILNIPASSNQQYRNLNFSVVAVNDSGDKDYYQVHVVDPSKEVSDFNINKNQTGFWYNPVSSGRGFGLEINEATGLAFLAWFTFDEEVSNAKVGDVSQRWLTALGEYSGNKIEMDISNVSNGHFDSADQVDISSPDEYGNLEVKFDDCNHGILSYNIHSLGLVGVIPIQRLFEQQCE